MSYITHSWYVSYRDERAPKYPAGSVVRLVYAGKLCSAEFFRAGQSFTRIDAIMRDIIRLTEQR